MPVTAKLSREFYERLGDKIADELVNWFNEVDATYRSDLRDLNDLNFARFDAKLEQRAAQLDAKIDQRVGRLEAKLEQRVAELDAKIDQRVGALEAKVDKRFAELEAKLDRYKADMLATLERRLGKQTRWLFGAWPIVLGSVIGLWFRS